MAEKGKKISPAAAIISIGLAVATIILLATRVKAAPLGAEFEVSDLTINPEEVNPGQPVKISCLVTNIGSEAGNYTVHLGGDFVGEQTVTLGPGESKEVSFEVTLTVTGTYSVTVDGLSGSFKVTTAPVADIRVENLRIVPTQVVIDNLVLIYVDIHNYSNFTGSRTIILTIDGFSATPRAPIIGPGQVKTESYGWSTHEPGTYQVSVGGLTGTLSVITAPVADIRVENLVISPTEVYVGKPVLISVRATNYGSASGSKVITFSVV